MSRKPMNNEARLSKHVSIRVSEAEYQMLKQYSLKRGKTFAQAVREMLIGVLGDQDLIDHVIKSAEQWESDRLNGEHASGIDSSIAYDRMQLIQLSRKYDDFQRELDIALRSIPTVNAE
tara:strand:- start:442 stop:798 length:357 start_codon:yes stop_codon:yes gene_type:complete